ncbi:DUF6691 family protein [Phenylobacterium sp.]|uniref:DUF6691 family protein n=1 Tax=Phenylobacterium sp. TaxID=1871053 RepID=UPI00262FAEF2|nr:DUF6691 family protein [Phenylobacterium sp.]
MNLAKILSALIAGLLFGAGLAVAGMTNPNKVLNFLDVTRHWDPSLAVVMASAIPVSALTFWLARRRGRPLFETSFVLPTNRRLERPLWIGSALFGIGWGLGGYCPGPAVASLAEPNAGLMGFLLAMGIGLLLSGRAAKMLLGSAQGSPAKGAGNL